jgi:hypothetical protein
MAEGAMVAIARHIADTMYLIGLSYDCKCSDICSDENLYAATPQVLRVIEITVLRFVSLSSGNASEEKASGLARRSAFDFSKISQLRIASGELSG